MYSLLGSLHGDTFLQCHVQACPWAAPTTCATSTSATQAMEDAFAYPVPVPHFGLAPVGVAWAPVINGHFIGPYF